jgi:hypothetical protein
MGPPLTTVALADAFHTPTTREENMAATLIPILGITTKRHDSPFWGIRQQMNISAGSES